MDMDDSVKLLDVYTKQIEMGTKLDHLVSQIPDHENRIRAIEKWKNAVPISVLVTLATAAGTIYALVHH